jgi:hypothetical protein
MSKRVDAILAERLKEYGDAYTEFNRIGRIWGALLGMDDDIAPHEVALMMDALKSVRITKNPFHQDSWDDKVGYTKHGRAIIGIDES